MKIHYLDSYMMNPTHPITIALIGAGGTGSNILTQLGRINYSLIELNHPGLEVTLFDPDLVSNSNIGRQLFSPQEIGQFKSTCLINRINRFYQTTWESIPDFFSIKHQSYNIVISAVDSAKSRIDIYNSLKKIAENTQVDSFLRYWIDTGNTRDTGQVICGTLKGIKQPEQSNFETVEKLPHLIDLYPDIDSIDEEEYQGPTCSVHQALLKQDLFINSMVAQYTSSLLFNLLKDKFTLYNGIFINLSNYKSTPIKLK